jgi:general secretion pathway protein K
VRNRSDKKFGQKQGFVLITLLWVLAALSLLALNLASTVRAEMSMARAAEESEKAYFYARGALEAVVYQMVYPELDKAGQKKLPPYADGMSHYWMHSPEIYCHVAVLDEAGKLDLNFAKEPALERLLGNIGVDPRLSALLAKSIMKWRGQENFPGAVTEKPRQFGSVEELLLVKGMTRDILYGGPRRSPNGTVGLGRGLAEYVTVYTGTPLININYAEPEAIAALPGMDMQIANSIMHAREKSAIKSMSDLSQRIPASIPGESVPLLSSSLSGTYSLVATAFLNNSKVHRSVKAVVKFDDALQLKHGKLIWYDEYWPAERVLKWTQLPEVNEAAQ